MYSTYIIRRRNCTISKNFADRLCFSLLRVVFIAFIVQYELYVCRYALERICKVRIIVRYCTLCSERRCTYSTTQAVSTQTDISLLEQIIIL